MDSRNVFTLLQSVVDGPPPTIPSEDYSEEFCQFVSCCLQKRKQFRPKYKRPPEDDPDTPPLMVRCVTLPTLLPGGSNPQTSWPLDTPSPLTRRFSPTVATAFLFAPRSYRCACCEVGHRPTEGKGVGRPTSGRSPWQDPIPPHLPLLPGDLDVAGGACLGLERVALLPCQGIGYLNKAPVVITGVCEWPVT